MLLLYFKIREWLLVYFLFIFFQPLSQIFAKRSHVSLEIPNRKSNAAKDEKGHDKSVVLKKSVDTKIEAF